MEDQQQHFRFLDLPPELRINVYEKAFEERLRVSLAKCQDIPSILFASKQIHDDAVMTFYRTTIFYFCMYTDGYLWYTRTPSKYQKAISSMLYDLVDELGIWEGQPPPPLTSLISSPLESIRKFWHWVEEEGHPVRQGVLEVSVELPPGRKEWVGELLISESETRCVSGPARLINRTLLTQ